MLKKLKLNGSMMTYKTFRSNTQKRCPFHYRGLECKSRKSRNTRYKRPLKKDSDRAITSVVETVHVPADLAPPKAPKSQAAVPSSRSALTGAELPQAKTLEWVAISFSNTFAFQSLIMKRTSFLGVSSERSCRSS